MIEPEVVLEKLGALGSSRAIAQFLKEEGVVGLRGVSWACPVANYVLRETEVVISISEEGWNSRGAPYTSQRGCVPYTVARFIRCFDEGEFPAIEKPS